MPKLKQILQRLYNKYNHRSFIGSDPLQFVYHYSRRADMEIAALLASCLAYGRVGQIENSLNDLLGRIEKSPLEFVKNFDSRKRARLKTFRHRFNSGDDISDLLAILKIVFAQYGSIETFFAAGYEATDKNVAPGLANFSKALMGIYAQKFGKKAGRGLKYLLPDAANLSVCKRLNLFLRWMVRNDNVDAGLWKSVSKSKLIVPVDTHMGRLCRVLGLYQRKTMSLAAAVEITENFAKIAPDDPVKYDFALSRIGIRQNCTGSHSRACADCELIRYCKKSGRKYGDRIPEKNTKTFKRP